MKKILGFLAILATLSGMSTMVMAKTFTDVKNTKYEEAVDILSDLKVVSGYEDGSYKPNNSVKRSEMAKLLVVALGKESSAASLEGDTEFSDVTAKHWASGYINLASSLGLIKGYPDGTFRPDATVSYVEASTMLLRALDYKTELDGLSWPTGYMSKANSAGILKNVTANSSSDAANRGNVASMVLNTLKGHKRKVVASNSTGNVYGDGDVLIEKAFGNYISVAEGTITDIDFDDLEITVQDKKNNRKLELVYEKDDIKKIFGRKISFLYDKKEEDFLQFEFVDDYTTKVVNVDEIDDDILFDDDDEYELPRSSYILMKGTSKYEDVEKAYLTLDNKKNVIYAVLEGKETIYVGVVTEKNLKINGKKAIEIRNIDGDYEELVLGSGSESVSTDDVILYTYNEDKEIVIRKAEEPEEASKIEATTTNSITLEDEDKITFSSSTSYEVYLIKEDKVEKGKLSDVEAEFDLATIAKWNDTYYILVFVDGIDPDDIEVEISVSEAKKDLYSVLKVARKKSESNYSVATFEAFREALEEAEEIYSSKTSYSAAKIVLATRKLSTTMSNLKSATSEDKEIRAAYSKLEDAIKSAEKVDSADYTKESYAVLTKAIAAAKKIDLKTTTVTKITDATNAITKARASLITNLASEQLAKIIARLDAAIKNAEAKLKNENSYTAASFKTMKTALTEAKAIDRTVLSRAELNTITTNLESAIEGLVSKEQAAYDAAKAKLDATIKTAKAKTETEHTAESWSIFKTELDKILVEYKNVANMSATQITQLNTRLETALKKLITVTEETIRQNKLNRVKEFISIINEYDEAKWNAEKTYPTWDMVRTKLAEAKKIVANPSSYTTDKLTSFVSELDGYILF